MVMLLVLLIFTSHCLVVNPFNIDTRNPVIITNNFHGPRSQFGATVAFAKTQNLRPSRTASWVIIGAPKADSPKFRNIQEPGLLWRCSLGKTNGDSCDILEMDNHGNEMQHHHAPGEEVYNRKDGGLFGGSLSVGTDRVIACASRWANQRANNISRTSHYLMNGICYWRPKTEILEDFVPELATNHTLIPLRNKDRQGFKGKQGFDWSFGQAGFSVHVTDGMETILGAPGIHDWKGAVIQLRDGDDPRLRRNGAAEEFGRFYQAPQLVMKPQLETLWTQNTTYFGYAVSSGKFLDSTNPSLQYVASAPRGGLQNNLTGHVIIFTFPDSADEPLTILSKIEGPTESATYFGSVLCSVDLNNDGWSDLLIGTPLLSTKGVAKLLDGTIGSASGNSPPAEFTGLGDEGAVFIYMSEREKMVSKGFVFGNNEPWSRFGSSIVSIGDINRDGFNDVAIGAPYEDFKRGAVYIYHGGPSGLTRKFAQVIHAREIDLKLAGFGFSLSPGVDVDGNGYNDVAVGAYTSSQVVILRTSPVVQIVGNLTSSIRRIPINRKDFKFIISSCVGFESKDSISQIGMGVKLYADFNSIVTRVFLKDGSLTPTNTIFYEQQVKHGSLTCRNYTGVVKQRLTLAGHRVVIRQEVSVINRGSAPQGSSNYTILPLGFGAAVPRTEQNGAAYNSFCKYCPVTEVNVTRFDLTLDPAVLCGEDEVCIADLEVSAEFSNYSHGEVFVIGSSPKLHLVIELKNNGGTAIYPKLEISWLRRSLVTVPSGCGQSKDHSTFELSCPLGQTLESGQSKVLELEFDMSDLMAGEQNEPNEFVANIDATTTSDLLKPIVVSRLILPIVASAKISVLATVKTMNITTLNPYNVFTHSYLLKLDGPSTLKSTELVFDLPESLIRTQHDRLITNITIIEAKQDGEEILCNGPERLSTLFTLRDPDVDGLLGEEDAPSQPRLRRRREKGTEKLLVHKKTLHINCNSHQVECVQIICIVHKFLPGTRTTVDFTFRMAKSQTLDLMEKYGVQNIEYKTRGKVRILNVPITVESKEASTRLELPVASSNTLIWVGSSIAAGLFIILCIGLLLFFCGVFDGKKATEEVEDEVPAEAIPLQTVEGEEGNDGTTDNGIQDKRDRD